LQQGFFEIGVGGAALIKPERRCFRGKVCRNFHAFDEPGMVVFE
jgi:hypothetical protein